MKDYTLRTPEAPYGTCHLTERPLLRFMEGRYTGGRNLLLRVTPDYRVHFPLNGITTTTGELAEVLDCPPLERLGDGRFAGWPEHPNGFRLQFDHAKRTAIGWIA